MVTDPFHSEDKTKSKFIYVFVSVCNALKEARGLSMAFDTNF